MKQKMAQTKVIVIGGGLSGLSAAQLLDQMGVEVLVLEASHRIGGRLHTTHNSAISYTDVGGAYVGPFQKRILRLADELNVKTYNVFTEKNIVHFRKGQIKKCKGSYFLPLSAGLLPFLDINNMMRTLDALAQTVSKSHPWEAPNAEVLDQMTFKEWLEKIMWTEHGMASARQFCEVNFTAEPHEISLLWALWYIKCAGGTASINSTEGGAQERKFIGGAQQIPMKIAETLGIGERVLTEKCVIKIHQTQESVTVSTSDGHKYHGSHVVLAVPPALQRKIEFEPPLPGNRNQLIAKYPMGSVIKTMMFYDQPYWREKGFNGNMEVEDASLDFPIGNTADDCKPDGSKPCIMGFILGSKATKMSVLTKEERMKKIAKQYSIVFDSPEMKKPVHYEEKDWTSDPWTGGCYTGYLPPGVLTLYTDTLRRATGRVYMAGTETATDWTGYMEGAVQAGERAATQILIDLNILTESEAAKEKKEVTAESSLLLKYAPSVGGLLQAVAATTGVAVILLSKL